MFINAFFELLALLGSMIVFGCIVITGAIVIFVCGNILRGLWEGFKKKPAPVKKEENK